MSQASNYLEEKLLDHVLRDTSYSPPSTIYVGLVDDNASEGDLESGDLVDEIDGYDGDRKTVTFTSPEQEDGKATVENEDEISFENMPAVTVSFVILTDDPSPGSGNILYYSEPDAIKTANSGDTYRILTGDLTVDVD